MDAGIRVSASKLCGGAVSSRCDGSALFEAIKLLGTGFPQRVGKIGAYGGLRTRFNCHAMKSHSK